jgi:hypothetical protein
MPTRHLLLGVAAALPTVLLVASCTLITGLPDVPTRAEGGAGDTMGDSTLDARPDAMGDAARDAPMEADVGPCDAGADPCACHATPTLMLQGAANVQVMAVVGDYLYWLGEPGGYDPALYRIPIDSVTASLPPYIHDGFALGGGNDQLPFNSQNFYVDIGSSVPYLAVIPIDDAGLTSRLTPNLPNPAAELRVGPAGVYWTNGNSEICSASLDGTLPAGDSGCGGGALAPAPDGGLKSYYNRLALAETSVFQSIYNTGEIRSVPVVGGAAQQAVQRSRNMIRPLFASDTDLVWSESTGDAGTIFHALPDGGDVTTLVNTAPIAMFAVDTTNVYFLTEAPGRVLEVPLDGGAAAILACVDAPQLLAIDSTRVYWWSGFDNTFRSVPK